MQEILTRDYMLPILNDMLKISVVFTLLTVAILKLRPGSPATTVATTAPTAIVSNGTNMQLAIVNIGWLISSNSFLAHSCTRMRKQRMSIVGVKCRRK